MINQLSRLSEQERSRLNKRKMPDWFDPMLATLDDEPFSNPDWLFERKLDGERCLVFKDGKEVRLLSRNGNDISKTYPELVEAVRDQVVKDFVVDGEIVAFSGGCTSFSRLQQRMQKGDEHGARESGVAVYLYLFDLLYLEGYDTTGLPLRVRKAVLKRAIAYEDPLRYTIHRNEQGESFFQEACSKGWEGLIAKDKEASYRSSRSRKWLKLKCGHRQELVIGGWTEPRGSREGFGALLVGYYDNGELVYAGKVGTGFDNDTLVDLHEKMTGLESGESPYDRGSVPSKGVHFVKPELVAEIGFTEWTSDGKLRHPRFLGLRRDKEAEAVVREQS